MLKLENGLQIEHTHKDLQLSQTLLLAREREALFVKDIKK